MSAPLKVISVLVLWILYTWFAYDACTLNQCCDGEAVSAVEEPGDTLTPPPATRYPIDFQWSNATAFTNEGFDALKQNLLAQLKENNILEITGLYFEGETTPEGFDNMGFARAASIRDLLAPEISADRISMRARLVDETEGVREGYFESVNYEWKTPETSVEEAVEELDDRVIIRFPFNSTVKDADPAVDEYLDKLAERVKQTGERITITGHTDSSGEADINQALGLRRAKEIRDILVAKGVNGELISTDSKGETQPVDSNETETGRHNNRRAEVRLIKN